MAELTDIPLCMDCKHCERQLRMVGEVPEQRIQTALRSETVYWCVVMRGQPNPITGQPIVRTECGFMRLGDQCGRAGKMFEPMGDKQ